MKWLRNTPNTFARVSYKNPQRNDPIHQDAYCGYLYNFVVLTNIICFVGYLFLVF